MELNQGTDLDTLDVYQSALLRDQINELGLLRTDLTALCRYTGVVRLPDALRLLDVHRVLEIGVGVKFDALRDISNALYELGEHDLSNVWAVDPELNVQQAYHDLQPTVRRITKRTLPLESCMDEVRGMFDVVLAKGVISIGAGFTDIHKIRTLLSVVSDTLNVRNQHSVAVISSKFGALLPFRRIDLIDAGMTPVYFMAPTLHSEWERRLRDIDQIDDDPFKLVICARTQHT